MLSNANPLYKKLFGKNIPNAQMKKLMVDEKLTVSGKNGKVEFTLNRNTEDGKYKGMPKLVAKFPNAKKK